MLPWIFLLLSVGAWWIVLTTRSMTELVLALVAAAALFVLGAWGLVSARVGRVARTQAARERALLVTTRVKPEAGGSARESARGPAVVVADGGSGGHGSRGIDRDPVAGDSADGGSGDGGGGGGGD
jgi:uncharacterized membrane protein YgcG